VDTCDVLIVGGGPAGSACGWRLAQAGLDVVIADKATFPRNKVCAGWITPQVIDELRIDPEEYRAERTFQPLTGFRVGRIGGDRTVDVSYDQPVSFGIRRCEFDDYLLRRSHARLMLGTPVSSLRRDGARWVLNESLAAPMLVGAAGHFCPVARMLNGAADRAALVAAQEVEFIVDPHEAASYKTAAERPELYFFKDFTGYGWCFRKGRYMNIGLGRLGHRPVPALIAEFIGFLERAGRIPSIGSWRWQGHAYLLSGAPHPRRTVADGVLLAGDAAGLAYPQSGEGIRPAIESGLIGASVILDARGRYTRQRLEEYGRLITKRFGPQPFTGSLLRLLPPRLSAALAGPLLGMPSFVRHVVLDRWFLHSHETALAAA
jgi:flavin-dependent dehydrogenase